MIWTQTEFSLFMYTTNAAWEDIALAEMEGAHLLQSCVEILS